MCFFSIFCFIFYCMLNTCAIRAGVHNSTIMRVFCIWVGTIHPKPSRKVSNALMCLTVSGRRTWYRALGSLVVHAPLLVTESTSNIPRLSMTIQTDNSASCYFLYLRSPLGLQRDSCAIDRLKHGRYRVTVNDQRFSIEDRSVWFGVTALVDFPLLDGTENIV